MPSALEYFGGPDSIYETISSRIHEARISCGLVQEELGELASINQPLQVADLETRKVAASGFSVADIISISTQLGLSIERLLPFKKEPNLEEKKAWDAEREALGAGPIVAANGNGQHAFDPKKACELYIRFKALEEVFTRPADSCR